MNGVIQGGWEYVYAAYGFTATALLAYLASVVWRLRAEARASAATEAAMQVERARDAAAPARAGAAS